MVLWFNKYVAVGNDFIVLDLRIPQKVDIFHFSKKFCNRNFGIGADGVVVIERSSVADFKMRIINADGTEAEMSGNGITCAAKYIEDFFGLKEVTFETIAGVKKITKTENGFKVEMGNVSEEGKIYDEFEGEKIEGMKINVGNPHIVIHRFYKNMSRIGEYLSKKYNANVEFFEGGEVYVWERGVGETLACGTGAVAVAYSLKEKGIKGKETYELKFKGGTLVVEISDKIFLISNSQRVFTGFVEI